MNNNKGVAGLEETPTGALASISAQISPILSFFNSSHSWRGLSERKITNSLLKVNNKDEREGGEKKGRGERPCAV